MISLIVSKMEPKEASHWVSQLLKFFPQANPPSPELVAAMVALACQYQREVVMKTFSVDMLPVKYNYLPSLKELKDELDNASAAAIAPNNYSQRVKKQIEERITIKKLTEYIGPIDEVRPGDILSVERQEEYRAFMKSKHPGVSTKMWGLNETWIDNGMRPFDVKLPPEPEEKNPFEDL